MNAARHRATDASPRPFMRGAYDTIADPSSPESAHVTRRLLVILALAAALAAACALTWNIAWQRGIDDLRRNAAARVDRTTNTLKSTLDRYEYLPYLLSRHPFVQEVLVKSILVTLSDAVAADNFTVLHAKISKPFREQFPPEKLRAVFKDLIDKRAVFDAIVAKSIVPDGEAKIDENGVLRLKGRFETTPKQVKYQLGFMRSDGVWKLSAVTINIE